MTFTLQVAPPSTTAQQQKRVRVVRNRRGQHVPVFYRGADIKRQVETWAALLRPHVPATPLTGPVALSIALVYPHLAKTPVRDQGAYRPKVSKPDVGNAVKEIEDTLVTMGFLADDQQVARLVAEKWHGPADAVGVHITIEAI